MKRKRGFTLIELLVVVAIIALLIAILLPSLGKARGRAKIARCLAQSRGIAQTLNIYMSDYNSLFPYYSSGSAYWTGILQSYGMNRKVWQCPEALGPNPNTGGTSINQGSSSLPWITVFPSVPNETGGFGLNGWLYRGAELFNGGPVTMLQHYAIDTNSSQTGALFTFPVSKQNSQIPMVGDASWPDGWPLADNAGPTNLQMELDGVGSTNGNMMRRWCLARHGKAINVAFMDAHAETVPLKQLWTLKWNANFVQPPVLPVTY